MEVVSVGGHFVILRDEGVVGISRRGHLHYFAKQFGFLHGLLGPYACVEIGSLLFEKVEGHHTELETGTTAYEEYRVAFGDVKQFLEEGLRFVHHRLKFLRAVADFHQGKAHALKFYTCLCRGFHYFLREDGGSRTKIVFLHN